MRILLDSDVLLDMALKREPFFAEAVDVIQWAQDEPGQAGLAWHSLSNIAYMVRREGREFIAHILRFVDVASVGNREARQAIGLPMNDLEDALQAAAALAFDAMFIVTRNIKDYKNSPIPAVTPKQFLEEIGRIQS